MRALALVAVLTAGCGTRTCKQGSVLLSLSYRGGAEAADEVDVTLTIGSGAPATRTVAHTVASRSGTLEIDFSSSYPSGQTLLFEVTARAGGRELAHASGQAAATPGCATLAITLDASLNDAAVDAAPADAADAAPADLSLPDLASPDLAPDFTLSVSPAPSALHLVVSSSASALVSLAPTSGFSDDVVVTVSGLPSGVTVDALTLPGGTTSGALTFHAAAGAALGVTSALTVTGSAGALSHDLPLALFVQGASGTLDTTFNTTGKLIVAVCSGGTGPGDGPGQAVVAPNGDIVVAGNCSSSAGASASMLALTSAGALDTGFNSTGKFVHAFTGAGTPADVFSPMAVQSDGKLIGGGFAGTAGQQHFFLAARLTAAGALDTAGFASPKGYDISDFDVAHTNKDAKAGGVAIRPDGNLVLVGFYVDTNNVYSAAMALYSSSGVLSKTTFNAPTLAYGAVSARADNFSVAVGSSGSSIAIARFNVAGDFDSSFGASGSTTVILPSNNAASANSVVVLGNNQLVIGGAVQPTAAGVYNAFVARLTESGALDTTFSAPNGYVSVTANNAAAGGAPVAVQSDGKVVVAFTVTGGTQDFALRRFNSDGTPDASFPAVQLDFAAANDVVSGLALQPDGRIVVAGQVNSGGRTNFGVARYWP